MRSILVAVVVLVCGVMAEAQQAGKIRRIGYVSGGGDTNTLGPLGKAFRQALRDLGYMEGKNIIFEYRSAEGNLDRIPGLVAELVQVKVDVLFVSNIPAIRAAKQTTKTIPIIMVTSVDPVATEIVDSLARPGGNLTGFTSLVRELSGKRLELLKEAIPRASRIGVLWDTSAPGPTIGFKEYEAVARALAIPLQRLEVRGPNPDLERALETAAKERTSALITITNPVLSRYQKQIADLAIKYKLPSMYERNQYVEAGGLMSYSTNDTDLYRRAASYVDKILKGTKPADLPVEQPMKFDLVINLKTAKQIGVEIPQWTLMKADRVIR